MHSAPHRSIIATLAASLALLWVTASAAAPTPRHGARGQRAAAPRAEPWWQHAVFYEIYPRSFQDSNGDGIGDLNGITRRLDYLESLGVDAIWITPFYPSPQVDFGYDISDYENVDPTYGNLADFDRLVAAAQQHHIRVLLDMVLNHTSDQHPWFLEAARSRSSLYHRYYVWSRGKPGPGGKHRPPNNWVSLFGGSAWQYVPGLDEFYYHKFYRQQPDLNWRNPQVERAMFESMRFWLDRGAAGFRLDAITTLFEDAQLRDAPPLPGGGRNAQGDLNLSEIRTNNLPEVHAVMRRLRAMIDHYPGERVLIGETYVPSTLALDAWYGGARQDELHLPMDTLLGFGNKLDARTFRRRLLEADTQLHGATPLFVFDNHDNPRSWDRYGDGVHNLEIAKIIATVLLTSRAAVLLYQGEELGQVTSTPERVEDVRDPIGITGWPREKGRDGERTPMQWDDSPQAGFSTNPRTWLPLAANHERVNVQSESADPNSLLSWHRSLIALRRADPALRGGRLVMLEREHPAVLAYARLMEDGAGVLVALNLSAQPQTIVLNSRAAGFAGARYRTLLSSPGPIEVRAPANILTLPPYAAWVGGVE